MTYQMLMLMSELMLFDMHYFILYSVFPVFRAGRRLDGPGNFEQRSRIVVRYVFISTRINLAPSIALLDSNAGPLASVHIN